jgi:hypothetical protein
MSDLTGAPQGDPIPLTSPPIAPPSPLAAPTTDRVFAGTAALLRPPRLGPGPSTAMHALGRVGEPEDVATAIAWLLDPAPSWVTGQVIGVDGGLGHGPLARALAPLTPATSASGVQTAGGERAYRLEAAPLVGRRASTASSHSRQRRCLSPGSSRVQGSRWVGRGSRSK